MTPDPRHDPVRDRSVQPAPAGPGSPGGQHELEDAATILRAWRCPEATVRRAGAMWRAEDEGGRPAHTRTMAALRALLESDDFTEPWLARFGLDETLAALAVVLARARAAARPVEAGPPPGGAAPPPRLLARCEQFGMWELKRALGDCRLQIADPGRHAEVRGWFERFQREHRAAVDSLVSIVEERVRHVEEAPEVRFDYCSISGASRRLTRLGRSTVEAAAWPQQFGMVTVILPSVTACYRALEAVHTAGLPEPGQFRDLVAAPNGNGYAGLCTSIWVETAADSSWARSQPVLRVALQTRLMHELSVLGIAHPAFRAHLRHRLQRQPDAGERCLARLAHSLTGDGSRTITVFTARGEARQVAAGATALDLAYRIHTEVGNYAVAAEVNGRRTALGTPLPPGARVTVLTDPAGEGRTEGDVRLVAEHRHRRRIIAFINGEPASKGRHAVVNHLRRRGVQLDVAELDALATEVAERFGHPDAAALYRAIAEAQGTHAEMRRLPGGAGRPTVGTVADELLRRRNQLVPEVAHPVYSDPTTEWVPTLGDGLSGSRTPRFRLCAVCRPARTVDIVGTERRGAVTVHLAGCHRVAGRPVLPLRWQRVERTVRATIAVEAWDRPRLVTDVLQQAHELNCGISEVRASVSGGSRASLRLRLHLPGGSLLVKLLEVLNHVDSVLGATVEEASLPASLLERIRTGPRDERLLDELETRGYRESVTAQVLIAPSVAQRRRTVRLPYTSNKPTHSPRSFVGRQADARWLATHTVEAESGGAALVLGPARVGKTSLCLRFLDQFPEPSAPPFRVDLRDLWSQTTEQAFASLVARLQPLANGPGEHRPTAAGVIELVRRGIEARDGRHTVIVLDEFGGPVRSLAAGTLGLEFFEVIPQLMDQRLPLSLVLVAVPEAHALMHRTGLWDPLRTCKDRQLGALEAAEARQMIVQPFAEQGIQWDEAAVAHVAHLSGRLPLFIIFLLQEIAHRLSLNAEKTYVQDEDVRAAAARLLRSESTFGYWLDKWRSSPVKRACMRAILQEGERGAIDEDTWRLAVLRSHRGPAEEFHAALNSLVAEGIMVRNAKKYRFAVPMFWSWLDLNMASAARARSLGLDE